MSADRVKVEINNLHIYFICSERRKEIPKVMTMKSFLEIARVLKRYAEYFSVIEMCAL